MLAILARYDSPSLTEPLTDWMRRPSPVARRRPRRWTGRRRAMESGRQRRHRSPSAGRHAGRHRGEQVRGTRSGSAPGRTSRTRSAPAAHQVAEVAEVAPGRPGRATLMRSPSTTNVDPCATALVVGAEAEVAVSGVGALEVVGVPVARPSTKLDADMPHAGLVPNGSSRPLIADERASGKGLIHDATGRWLDGVRPPSALSCGPAQRPRQGSARRRGALSAGA